MPCSPTKLFKEARRRRVFRLAGLYIVAAWVLLQVASLALPAFAIPGTAIRYVWAAVILGFPAALIFAWRYDFNEGRVVRTAPELEGADLSLQRADILILAALTAVVIAIAAGSISEIRETPRETGATIPVADADPASVAVLPFVNISGDPDNEYFSDGLTETLLHMLAQLRDLKVSARTSTFVFKGRDVDIREIGQLLSVAHILEGSVQKAGNRVRITAQLIRSEDGFHVWSHNYDRTLEDIFAIQDEIATDVAEALGSTLLANDPRALSGVATSDLSAYDLYLRALEQQALSTHDALAAADSLLQQVLAIDPAFLDARLGLVRNQFMQIDVGAKAVDQALALAAETLVPALEHHPDTLEVRILDLYLQGWQAHVRLDVRSNLNFLEQVAVLLRETAGESYIRSWVATVLGRHGQHNKAQSLLDAGLTEDPLNIDLVWALAQLYIETARAEEAQPHLMKVIRATPDNPLPYVALADVELARGNPMGWAEWTREAVEVDPDNAEFMDELALFFWEWGFLKEGDYWLERSLDVSDDTSAQAMMEFEATAARGVAGKIAEHAERILGNEGIVTSYRFYSLILSYSRAMRELGRSQEALNFLAARFPGFNDLATLPDQARRASAIDASLELRLDVLEQDDFQQALDTWMATLESAELRHPEDPFEIMYFAVLLGDLDSATAAFRNGVADLGATDKWWQVEFTDSLYDAFRQTPEVAARWSEVQRERAAYRSQIERMLQGPDWQH